MTAALVFVLVTLSTQSPTLATVAALGYVILVTIARAALDRRTSMTGVMK